VMFNAEGEFVVSYTVTNIGCAEAGNSTTCKFVNGELMEKQPCPALKPGESYTSSFMPEECPCGAKLNVTVCADCGNEVEESNETNNCEVNIVECPPGVPSIEVEKTVWDQVVEEWVDELTAPVGETVTFNSTVHNNGECCNLTNITVTDTLSNSFEFVNATPEPDAVSETSKGTVLTWYIPGSLAPCESLTFLINASLIETGDDTNVQNATGWCKDTMVTANDTAIVHSVRPEGGIGIAVLPRFNTVRPGESVNLSIKVVNMENFGDVFLVRLTNKSIPAGWRADLSWFNWTSTLVRVPAGGEAVIPLRADIPGDAPKGYKAFRAVASSTKWTPSAFDTGVFHIL